MRAFGIAAVLWGALTLGVPGAAGASSLDIPANSSNRDLWRAVMTGLYGPYNARQKCWIGKVDGDSSCMRPVKLDRVEEDGVSRLYLATGGGPVSGNDCHGCGGYVGLIVLAENGGRYRLAADNGLHETMGGWGAPPPEENFAFHALGPQVHGWTIESGFTGQGVTIGGQTVHAVRDGKVTEIGQIPTMFDNCGFDPDNCRTREATVGFDMSSPADPYHSATVVIGKAEPPVAQSRFIVPFDKDEGRYVVPADLQGVFE